MTITNCTLDDFNEIFTDIADFWGHDRTRYRQHSLGVSAARRRRRPGLAKERDIRYAIEARDGQAGSLSHQGR